MMAPVAMRCRLALLGLALLAAAGARAECRLGHVATMPVRLEKQHLIVKGTVDEHPAEFVFDTGSATTFLTAAAVARLDLRAMRSEAKETARFFRIEGIGGVTSGRPVVAKSIDLGGLRARDYAFIVADMDLSAISPSVDGLLSADLLAKYDLDLNLAGGNIGLYYPLSDCSHPAARLAGQLYMAPLRADSRERSPRITVDIAGQNFDAVIDTGAPLTALLRAAARAAIAEDGEPQPTRVRVRGIGSDSESAGMLRLKSLGIGELALDNYPVLIVDRSLGADLGHVDVLLGLDFLTRIHTWISYSSNTLIMQYPPKPSPE